MPGCSFTERDALLFNLYARGKSNTWIHAQIDDLKVELLHTEQEIARTNSAKVRLRPRLEELQCLIPILEGGLKKRQAKERV